MRSGRTTALRTLAAQLADRASPADLHLYALDCGNRGLAALGDLPHCGAVVDGDDTERVERLLAMLADELDRRRRVSSGGSVTARSPSSAADVTTAGSPTSSCSSTASRRSSPVTRSTTAAG